MVKLKSQTDGRLPRMVGFRECSVLAFFPNRFNHPLNALVFQKSGTFLRPRVLEFRSLAFQRIGRPQGWVESTDTTLAFSANEVRRFLPSIRNFFRSG